MTTSFISARGHPCANSVRNLRGLSQKLARTQSKICADSVRNFPGTQSRVFVAHRGLPPGISKSSLHSSSRTNMIFPGPTEGLAFLCCCWAERTPDPLASGRFGCFHVRLPGPVPPTKSHKNSLSRAYIPVLSAYMEALLPSLHQISVQQLLFSARAPKILIPPSES